MDLRPLRNNIIVRRVPMPSESDIIVIPDSRQKKSLRAEVVALGPATTALRVGEIIAFGETASQHPFAHNNAAHWDADDELLVLSEKDVLGVIE